MGDPIDHSVGLEMLVRIGDRVSRGTPLVKIFSEQPQAVLPALRAAIKINETGTAPELIVERIGKSQGSK
jgi:thymidine phosphorylase